MTVFVVLIALVLDRATKYLAQRFLAGEASIPIIKGVLQLTYTRNTGAAFSIFSGHPKALGWFTLIVCAGLIVFLYRQKKANPSKKLYQLSLAMILGGAFGNMIDRFLYGYVIDFVDLIIINFAVFNVADMFITVGGVIFCCCLVFDREIKL